MTKETKVFELPKHPRREKADKIVIEKPDGSVWHLVLDAERAIPLPALSKPNTAREVLDAFRKQCGESAVGKFIMEGFSKVD